MVKQLELIANTGEEFLPGFAIPDEPESYGGKPLPEKQPEIKEEYKDPNRIASPEEAAEFLRRFRERVANPNITNIISSQSSTLTEIAEHTDYLIGCEASRVNYSGQKPTTPRTPKPRQPRIRYKTPQQYKDFLWDANDYLRTSFTNYTTEKIKLITKHFPTRVIPEDSAKVGSMFQHICDSAEKYVMEARK